MLVIGIEASGSAYTDAAHQNDLDIGCRIGSFADKASALAFFPNITELGQTITSGYVNLDNGWAFATGGISGALDEVRRLGAEIRTACSVQALDFDTSGRVNGVKLASGDVMLADTVVVATGSWTGSAFSSTVGENVLATGCIS